MAEEKDNKVEAGGTSGDVQAALDREAARANPQDRIDASLEQQREEREALTKEADIGAAGTAKGNMDASGAIMEPATKSAIDVDHPAVDNNPRAGTTERQNQIDFNDPTLNDRQAVEQRLDQQG